MFLLIFVVFSNFCFQGRRNVGLVAGFSPYALKETDFVPKKDEYQNLDQKGLRRKEVTAEDVYLTLDQLFMNPQIMQQHAICILGPPGTTGYGKTCLARSLAANYLAWRVNQGLCTEADTFCHVSSTMDFLKDKVITMNHCIILDEFKPGDRDQNPRLSEDGMKVLLDVRNVGSISTRFGDTFMPNVPRLFTANAATPHQWTSPRFPFSLPMQRKAYVFVISKALLAPAEEVVVAEQRFGQFFNCNLA